MEKLYLTKVYTVRVNYKISSRHWYHKYATWEFDCVLKAKNIDKYLVPVFYVVEKNSRWGYVVPSVFLTIRPEDCSVVWEANEMVRLSFYEFARRTEMDLGERRPLRGAKANVHEIGIPSTHKKAS
jgi:hypothetical protein